MTAFMLKSAHVRRHRQARREDHVCILAMEVVDDNQFTLRESKRRVVPSDFAFNDMPEQRHSHVFVRDELVDTFEDGFRRTTRALRENAELSVGSTYICCLKHVADPSWGKNLGSPPPHPRYLIVENVGLLRSDQDADKGENGSAATGMQNWLTLLEEAHGEALLRDLSHVVSYRMAASAGDVEFGLAGVRNMGDVVVITEMINADWTSLNSVNSLLELIKERANASVESGHTVRFDVLQSEAEPSFFKTIEYYKDEASLINFVNSTDKEFAQSSKPFKAAVYRVRQAFRILRP